MDFVLDLNNSLLLKFLSLKLKKILLIKVDLYKKVIIILKGNKRNLSNKIIN